MLGLRSLTRVTLRLGSFLCTKELVLSSKIVSAWVKILNPSIAQVTVFGGILLILEELNRAHVYSSQIVRIHKFNELYL
jgi:hypothetical protein